MRNEEMRTNDTIGNRQHERMRLRLLLPMCAVSASLSVTLLNSAALCGGHSVQPLPNHFDLVFSYVRVQAVESRKSVLWRRNTQIMSHAKLFTIFSAQVNVRIMAKYRRKCRDLALAAGLGTIRAS